MTIPTTPSDGDHAPAQHTPTLAVWKFASCDGCQLSLLDCEDELLAVAGRVRIASFPEATRTVTPGPYDLSLVEGSITTLEDVRRIHEVREQSRFLVVLGACGSSGGIQALRNFGDVAEFAAAVYAKPAYISTLADSTPIRDHVRVDYELRGCPVDRHQLLEVITAFLAGRKPSIPDHSVCHECKARGTVCVTVARGTPCLGPVTHAGCGALCPAFDRGCFGCFGATRQARVDAMARLLLAEGAAPDVLLRTLSMANPADPAFRSIGDAVQRQAAEDRAARNEEVPR
jgi:coenzyme F420-reducing hydrogenase gamma subunit